MAGVTDRPFRMICAASSARASRPPRCSPVTRGCGARRSRGVRMDHAGEPEPRVVQLAGADPRRSPKPRASTSSSARRSSTSTWDVPRKKCARLCGSALLTDEPLVARILDAVVRAVERARDAQDPHRLESRARNGVRIAQSLKRAAFQRLPCTAARARIFIRRSGVRHDSRDQIACAEFQYSRTVISIRRKKRARCLISRRRRSNDRPRGAWRAMDFSRCQFFFDLTEEIARRTSTRRSACYHPRAPRIPVRFLRRRHRGASRTQTSRLVFRNVA